ncbi:hypothetical protein MBLNU457_3715t1 [Dothideomycetes sp. NU457]
MFSLPLVTPPTDFSPFLSTFRRPQYDDIPAPIDPDAPAHQRQPTRRPNQLHGSARNPLAQLKADEEAIRKRKDNIARFGSTWIKPPGISKTLQAETEERLEREEQEVLARREQMMMDMQAQQEAEEARQRAAQQADAEEAGDVTQERDLDEDIPDADEDIEPEDDEEEEEEDQEEIERDLDDEVPEATNITFGDESLLEGSMLDQSQVTGVIDQEQQELAEQEMLDQERYAQLEEAELTGIAQDQFDLGMEANLDDSVPEAGSYEHTDSELEDSSDEDNDESMLPPAVTVQTAQGRARGLFGSNRSSLRGRESTGSRQSTGSRDMSSLLESSFVGSSPVLGRLRGNNQRVGR